MKKLISSIAAAAVALTSVIGLGAAVSADDADYSFSISVPDTAAVGDIIAVDVNIDTNSGAAAITAQLTYDNTALQIAPYYEDETGGKVFIDPADVEFEDGYGYYNGEDVYYFEDGGLGWSIEIGPSYDQLTLNNYINFVCTNTRSISKTGTLATVYFTVLDSTAATSLNLSVEDVYTNSGTNVAEDEDVDIETPEEDETVITIEGVSDIVTKAGTVTDDGLLPVYIVLNTNDNSAASIAFTFTYDTFEIATDESGDYMIVFDGQSSMYDYGAYGPETLDGEVNFLFIAVSNDGINGTGTLATVYFDVSEATTEELVAFISSLSSIEASESYSASGENLIPEDTEEGDGDEDEDNGSGTTTNSGSTTTTTDSGSSDNGNSDESSSDNGSSDNGSSNNGGSSDSGSDSTNDGNPETGVALAVIPAAAVAAAIVATKKRK